MARMLGGVDVQPGHYRLDGDAITFVAESGLALHYRKGEGVTADRPAGYDPAEELLWLNGTIYAAIASIHGFYPIHASAVACAGRVHAFTGPSGAGKSTLTAQLGQLGLPMFCDDTLILDLSDPEQVMCLPGHKRLKLWPDALGLTGAAAEEEVRNGMGKHFAAPPAGTVADMLPLTELCFLEEGEPAQFVPVNGAAKLMRLQDDHYTTSLFLAAARLSRAERFHMLGRMAQIIPMHRFIRPRDPARFAAGAQLAMRHVTDFSEDS
ncbi:MAG: hypothetical protein KGL44_07640 [Sphingomonadales bacterium]|nr:hypothetical protein [Sphingomonadales bacterium]